MLNSSKRLLKAEQKEKIRQRYRGMDTSNMEVIPAEAAPDFYDEKFKRVAVYVRVSTDNIQQTTSFEIQKNYYEDMVDKHDNWALVDIYADEGISGTSLMHREAFNQMIDDCKAGKIDLIITKSVSRFARNIVDCIRIVRELSEMRDPVGVFFETEHIFTLKEDTEMTLSFQAAMAQEESHAKSRIMNSSLEMRFSHGILLTPELYGYRHNEEGKLIICEEEAPVVRLIFFMYLYGYTSQQIADTLTKLEILTPKGKSEWASGTVLGILRNERHCGDVLTRKTYTPNYLNHKSVKNRGNKTQHLWREQHEGIVSRDDFIAVQHLINNAKYGNKGILPELKVISSGALKGFVSINPRWGGFTRDDYYKASASVVPDTPTQDEPIQVTAKSGEFDLRGFEIARSQFFDTQDKMCISFFCDHVTFSTSCIKKFDKKMYVEILVNPVQHLLAVRPCDKTVRNALKWSRLTPDGDYVPKVISGAAFIKTMYDLFEWVPEYRYRIRGIKRTKGDESILIFDLKETELFIPKAVLDAETQDAEHSDVTPVMPDVREKVVAYPNDWADSFGSDYYLHAQTNETPMCMDGEEKWEKADAKSIPFMPELQVTAPNDIANNIQQIISDIKNTASKDGADLGGNE